MRSTALARAARSLLRAAPSLKDFAFLLPVLWIFGRMGGARALLGDADTGWHIRTGEWILANGQVPARDLFSFTMPNEPWYAWEWLCDILLALLYRAGGLQAVVLASIALICLTVFLLFQLAARKSGNAAIAFLVTGMAAADSSIHWLARPHLFTLLFVVVFCTALETWTLKRQWLLPLLLVLWTNLHGGFFIGILLIAVWAVGAAMERDWRKAWHYTGVAGAGLAASLINPYTWHLHEHLLDYLGHPGYFQGIQEFEPLRAGHPLALIYEVMLFLGIGGALHCLRRREYAWAILLLLWAHLSLPAARNIALFCLIAATPVAVAISDWVRGTAIERLSERLSITGMQPGMRPGLHLMIPVAFMALTHTVYSPRHSELFECSYDPHTYPALAITQLRPTDRVFADDEWGDYLIFHTRPQIRVFIDGRSDFYGPEFERAYDDILHVRRDWKRTLAAYQINTVLAHVDMPLTAVLRESPEWVMSYEDKTAVIFRRCEGRCSVSSRASQNNATPGDPARQPPRAFDENRAFTNSPGELGIWRARCSQHRRKRTQSTLTKADRL